MNADSTAVRKALVSPCYCEDYKAAATVPLCPILLSLKVFTASVRSSRFVLRWRRL